MIKVVIENALPQFCPEPPPPCSSQTEQAAPLLLHQQYKRQAEEIGAEPASPDSGLTSESTSSTDADTDSTERDPNADLFNGAGPYPAAGLPYPPSTFAQSAPFTPYGRSPYLGFGGYPAFGGYPTGSLNPQPFLGSYRGHPYHRGPHPEGYHVRH